MYVFDTILLGHSKVRTSYPTILAGKAKGEHILKRSLQYCKDQSNSKAQDGHDVHRKTDTLQV